MEPMFMPYYMRRKKVNPSDPDSRVDFTDQNGDTWQEYPIVTGGFKEWMLTAIFDNDIDKLTSTMESMSKADMEELFKASPYYGSTANEINWINRVKIQGIIQKYITHSISSTINLPSDVTTDEVSDIYLASYKEGLKGITVYRDGSRSGVLVSDSSKEKSNNNFEYKDAVKRPTSIDGDAYVIKSKGIDFNVFIGTIDKKPYEVFINSTSKLKGSGKIIKSTKGKYLFKQDDNTFEINSDISDEQAAITRLMSTSLRHGTDIKFIVEQLNKIDGDMFSFAKVLSRTLKKYIPEGTKSSVTCKECGSNNVIFQEGCSSCQDCGSSKCS